MAMAIPPNPPVAMHGQHVATVGEVIQNSINGHRWSTGGKPLATDGNWQFSHLVAQFVEDLVVHRKGNYGSLNVENIPLMWKSK